MASGQVIGSLHARHRAIEFTGFLARLDRETPPDLDLHLILDNYATHKTPAVHRWLLAHPRFHLHVTPTSASWLNMVKRWFSECTEQKIRRGTHRTVRALQEDLRAWIGRLERQPQAVRLGQDRRRHPCQRRPLLSTNL